MESYGPCFQLWYSLIIFIWKRAEGTWVKKPRFMGVRKDFQVTGRVTLGNGSSTISQGNRLARIDQQRHVKPVVCLGCAHPVVWEKWRGFREAQLEEGKAQVSWVLCTGHFLSRNCLVSTANPQVQGLPPAFINGTWFLPPALVFEVSGCSTAAYTLSGHRRQG